MAPKYPISSKVPRSGSPNRRKTMLAPVIAIMANKNRPAIQRSAWLKRVLIFSRTKHGSDKIVRQLGKANIKSAAIHGNKSQGARQRALGNFKKGELNVLIATDIAARGIDVEELSLVINFDLPNIPETYVHRIGRTGRAKASGIALSFCNNEEKAFLKDIQKLIKKEVPMITDHPFVDTEKEPVGNKPKNNKRNHRSRQNNNNNKPKKKSWNRNKRPNDSSN